MLARKFYKYIQGMSVAPDRGCGCMLVRKYEQGRSAGQLPARQKSRKELVIGLGRPCRELNGGGGVREEVYRYIGCLVTTPIGEKAPCSLWGRALGEVQTMKLGSRSPCSSGSTR